MQYKTVQLLPIFCNNTELVALIHFNLLLLMHFQLCFSLCGSVSYVVLFYLFRFLLSIQSENVFASPSKLQVSEDTENLISLALFKSLMKILKLYPFTLPEAAQLNTDCYLLKVDFHISTFPLRLFYAAVSKAFSHLDCPPQFLNTSLESRWPKLEIVLQRQFHQFQVKGDNNLLSLLAMFLLM